VSPDARRSVSASRVRRAVAGSLFELRDGARLRARAWRCCRQVRVADSCSSKRMTLFSNDSPSSRSVPDASCLVCSFNLRRITPHGRNWKIKFGKPAQLENICKFDKVQHFLSTHLFSVSLELLSRFKAAAVFFSSSASKRWICNEY